MAIPYRGLCRSRAFELAIARLQLCFDELRKPLLRYLVCLGLSSDEAQDVVQDAFLSLHRHLSSGGSQENIRSWLFRVAHNQARNRQNSYDRRFSAPLDDAGAEWVLDEATPERVLLEKEKFKRLGNAIRTLGGRRARMPAAARERLAVSRDRGSAGDRDVDGSRYCGARGEETGGEMQCVNIREG